MANFKVGFIEREKKKTHSVIKIESVLNESQSVEVSVCLLALALAHRVFLCDGKLVEGEDQRS